MLHEVIGTPAMLEQTAEECCELAQACLKMSRFIRDENDVNKPRSILYKHLTEEIADINICISELMGIYEPEGIKEDVNDWTEKKIMRMQMRLSSDVMEEP